MTQVIDEKKERCFIILDELSDEGFDLTRLHKELNPLDEKRYSRVRKRLSRVFGSVDQALKEYGLVEESLYAEPTSLELYRCFYISDTYEVVANTYEKERIKDLYHLSDTEFNKLTLDIRRDYRRDALDEFYRNEFPENTKHTFMDKPEYRHLWSYMQLFYRGLSEFMESYGTPSEVFVERNYGGEFKVYRKAGDEFERLVGKSLSALGLKFLDNKRIGNCQPDFSMPNHWVDAKLHYKSVFQPACKTIEKYAPVIERLTIIYCFGDGSATIKSVSNLELLKITELYQPLYEAGAWKIVDEIERFIKEYSHLYE